MSQLIGTNRAPADPSTAGPARPRRADRAVVAWCLATAALLGVSGFYRGAQASRLAVDTGATADSPFPLRDIPNVIDTWRVVEGGDTQLDPQTARITGSTDHIVRTYCDEMTGVTLSVLILYGPAGPVVPHTPQVCYPASGFALVGGVLDREVAYGQDKVADFRTSVFAKSGGRSVIYQTVYHSYQLDEVWSPAVENRKFPRRNPGVFKVQIQRRTYEQEVRGENEPIEGFLSKLLPIIEKMTAEARTRLAPTREGAATKPA